MKKLNICDNDKIECRCTKEESTSCSLHVICGM
jgi:hypothetical protein